MSSLIDRLTAVNARLKALPSKLGVPQYIPVALESGSVQTLLVPEPKVEQARPGTGEHYLGTNNVYTNEEFYWVRGIPRTYAYDFVTRSIYILNATGNGVYTGKRCQVVYTETDDILEYSTLVQVLRKR